MALFTDAPIIGLEDLAGQDAGILEMAATEGIDLEGKILIARDEIGIEIETALVRSGLDQQGNGFLNKLVVTPPLRLYWVFHAITVTYRDVSCSRLNDRYKSKRDEYRDCAKWAAAMLYELGVGWVADPIPQPPPPSVAAITGDVTGGVYYIRVSGTNLAGQESLASPTITYTASSGEGLQVEMTDYPGNLAGWNVYLGTTPELLFRQNMTTLPVGAPWSATSAILLSGQSPGAGQQPDHYTRIQATIQRG